MSHGEFLTELAAVEAKSYLSGERQVRAVGQTKTSSPNLCCFAKLAQPGPLCLGIQRRAAHCWGKAVPFSLSSSGQVEPLLS